MKTTTLILAGGLLAVLPLSAQAKIVRNVEKTFAVQPGGNFKAATSGGDIVIKTGAGDQVRVIAKQTIRASNDAEADELLKKLELTIAQEGNDVVATSKYASKIGGVSFGIWPPVSVDFEVTLPASFNVELKTSGGDIVCGDLQGKAAANTSGGDVMLGHIGGEVQVHTSGGDIVLEQAAGSAKLHTSGGDIKVGSVLNTLDASTSGGDVSARLSGGLKGDCSLSTSGGDIRAVVDDNAAFQLDASTSGGDVEAYHLTLTIERGGHGKSKLAGKVNGGGPILKLRTSGGDIDIKGVPAAR
jgi:DUF4097 and DUF4098 domain-containing protein YvlB